MYCLEADCVFCKIAKKELESNIVYESEKIMVIMTIEPLEEGHVLIIPKRHYHDLDEVDDQTALEIMAISKKMVKVIKTIYKPLGYSIMQNGGDFNDIGHYHMHIFPRYENGRFGWTFGEVILHRPLSETKELLKLGLETI